MLLAGDEAAAEVGLSRLHLAVPCADAHLVCNATARRAGVSVLYSRALGDVALAVADRVPLL